MTRTLAAISLLLLCVGSSCGPPCAMGEVSTVKGIAMAHICAGSFTMGSPLDEVGHGQRECAQSVELTGGFHLGVHEVTQAEFVMISGYQPSAYPSCESCPVENVNWWEAAAFANALSRLTGLEECFDCSGEESDVTCSWSAHWDSPYDCPGYRLPTEAEWEYAARAGTGTAFNNGGNLESGDKEDCQGGLELDNGASLDELALYCGNNSGHPEPVGSREPNAWGLFDIHGNVWEWCDDSWGRDCGEPATDPWKYSTSVKVRRGGGWGSPPYTLRSGYRGADRSASSSFDTLGFRLARSD